MRKKERRRLADEAHAELISRELGWLESVSVHLTAIIFGAPMRCPSFECGDFGLVESVAEGRQHNRCWSCGMTWTLSTQAMALFAQACKPQDPATIIGAGTLVADLEPANASRTTRERFVGVRAALQRDPESGPGSIAYLPNH